MNNRFITALDVAMKRLLCQKIRAIFMAFDYIKS